MSAPGEEAVLAAQMGRSLAGESAVVSRCELGLPVVIEVEPEVEGRPFPTLYYLTCPLARARISRLEAAGGVRAAQARLAEDPELARRHQAAQAEYAARRAGKLAADSPVRARLRGGVGGAEGGVKCLHAQYAHARAGRDNPIGEEVAHAVEPLGCTSPCVLREGGRNPAWREPTA